MTVTKEVPDPSDPQLSCRLKDAQSLTFELPRQISKSFRENKIVCGLVDGDGNVNRKSLNYLLKHNQHPGAMI